MRISDWSSDVCSSDLERSLNIDFLLGYLKQLLPRRPDLKIIITSATIDAERFARHFAASEDRPAPVIEVSGRLYPVEVRYRPVRQDEAGDEPAGGRPNRERLAGDEERDRSEEHTSELQSLMRNSYAVFCLKKKKRKKAKKTENSRNRK